MPEGEKHWGGGPVVIGGENLPSPVQIGLSDLQNIGGPLASLAPPGSGTTITCYIFYTRGNLFALTILITAIM